MTLLTMSKSFALRYPLAVLVGALVTTTSLAATAADDASASEATPSEEAASASPSDSSESGDASDEEVATNVPEKKTVLRSDTTYSHKGQFNVRVALGGGYRIVMRYDNSPLCSQKTNDAGEPLTLCGFGAPLTLDTAVGFAPVAGVEPFLWGRFGLGKEANSNTEPLVILGAGARLYTMSDSAFKFFIEPAVGVELEKGTTADLNRRYQYKQDLIVRLTIGPHFDFARNIGAYAAAGLTVGMLRSLQTWMDLHVGVQARFP